MRLRPYTSLDFEKIKNWASSERTHAMWCANLMEYPLEKNNFDQFFAQLLEKTGDIPFVATTDDGQVAGFFCYSINTATNQGFLKFVMVDSSLRGKGYGTQMIELSLKYAFEITKAAAVDLIVFSCNEAAKKCYLKAGFKELEILENSFTYKEETWKRCKMRCIKQ